MSLEQMMIDMSNRANNLWRDRFKSSAECISIGLNFEGIYQAWFQVVGLPHSETKSMTYLGVKDYIAEGRCIKDALSDLEKNFLMPEEIANKLYNIKNMDIGGKIEDLTQRALALWPNCLYDEHLRLIVSRDDENWIWHIEITYYHVEAASIKWKGCIPSSRLFKKTNKIIKAKTFREALYELESFISERERIVYGK